MSVYLSPASAATITASELMQRLLDAPVREKTVQSSLINFRETEASMQQYLFGGFQSECFPDFDLSDQVLEALRECDDPELELDLAIGDLEQLLEGLRTVQREFSHLCEECRTDCPDDASDEVFHEWSSNPRYILPLPVENLREEVKDIAQEIDDEARADLTGRAA